jgi:molybdopterin biosynthesis enzyme
MVAADCLALVPAGGGELAAGERVAVEWLPGRQ